ncbi:MAG: hypothetical protein ACHQFZ_01975 [Acidimicrobiales bacterium]
MISLPDGWSSRTSSSAIHFTSTVNSIDVSWRTDPAGLPELSLARSDVAALRRSLAHFQFLSLHPVALAGGPAVLVEYRATSSPDPVTGRNYRLIVERFTFVKRTRVLILSLSSPIGADNVDPWRIISQSVRFTD